MNNKIAKIRILDETTAIIVGLDSDHINYFYDKYAFHAPNYVFNPKYKLGQWDGKIRFFHKTGKTYFHLLEDILPRVNKLGYKIQLEDLRDVVPTTPLPITPEIFKHILHLDTSEEIIMRDFQVEAVNALLTHGNGVVVASTGSGKTLLCAGLVKAYDNHNIKSLTIVPDQNLIHQTKVEYINCELDTGEYSGNAKTLNHRHVVSTWQALQNNPGIIQQFQMVIVDECHGLKGNVLSKILIEHAKRIPYRFGVTGTLPKDKSDLWAVHIAVGPVRYTVDAAFLIDEGILAKLHIDVLQLEENLEAEYQQYIIEENVGKPPTYPEFKDEYFPDFSSEKSYLRRNEDRLDWIASYIEAKRNNKKGNVLCLVDSIPLARTLAAKIENAIVVNGQDVKTAKDRLQIYNLFKEHDDLVVVATVNIAGTGLNIRRIFNLVFIDIGKSFIRVIQAIGRGLRKADDKDFVNITDICSDLKYSKKHTRDRISFYKEASYPYKKTKVTYRSKL